MEGARVQEDAARGAEKEESHRPIYSVTTKDILWILDIASHSSY